MTEYGATRIIARAFRNFQRRPVSEANKIWETVRNDDTPGEKKFLGLNPQKIRRPDDSYIEPLLIHPRRNLVKDFAIKYPNHPDLFYKYDKYSWAGMKKYQLSQRLYTAIREQLKEQGYKVYNSRR